MKRSFRGISLALASVLLFGGNSQAQSVPGPGQDKPHVVSITDLKNDAARMAQRRRTDEQAVRTLLSSEKGQEALKSAHLDYESVDKAVGQLSDEELARLALRSRRAQADFAAGHLSKAATIGIVVAIAAAIILASVFYTLSKD